MVATDAPAVRHLTRAAYAKWIEVIAREPLPMAADHERAIREHRIDLLVEADLPVALVEMILRPGDLLVESLAVAPDRQGRGLGQMLLAHAEAVADQHHRPLVRLYTNALFVSNLRFYEARGFAIERVEPFRGGSCVHLAKRLRDPKQA